MTKESTLTETITGEFVAERNKLSFLLGKELKITDYVIRAIASANTIRKVESLVRTIRIQRRTKQEGISMFYREFVNTIIDKRQHMHLTFNIILV